MFLHSFYLEVLHLVVLLRARLERFLEKISTWLLSSSHLSAFAPPIALGAARPLRDELPRREKKRPSRASTAVQQYNQMKDLPKKVSEFSN